MNEIDYKIYCKGLDYQNQGQYALAIENYSLLVKKKNKKAIFTLAKLFLDLKEENKALNYFFLGNELGNNDCAYYIGLIYYKNKEYVLAKKYFEMNNTFTKRYLYLGIIEMNKKIKYASKWKAVQYFFSGSKKRVFECDYYLAYCFHYGIGVKKDCIKERIHLLRAKNNNIVDLFNLYSNN